VIYPLHNIRAIRKRLEVEAPTDIMERFYRLSRDRAICVLAGDVEGVKKIEAQEIELHNNFALGK
jgi:hypothetical protein